MIPVQLLVVYIILSYTVGAKGIYISDSSQTWNHAADNTACTMATFSEVDENVFIPTSTGTFWISSENMITQWILMEGCFSFSQLYDGGHSREYSTIENCLEFCVGGRFGISENKCVCQKKIYPKRGGCLGKECFHGDRQVFCGDTASNFNINCMCHYRSLTLNNLITEDKDAHCVACEPRMNECHFHAHTCSDHLPVLCVDISSKNGTIPNGNYSWLEAGLKCFKINRQFLDPFTFSPTKEKSNIQQQLRRKYWVPIFRREIHKNDIRSDDLYDYLLCSAVKIHGTHRQKVLRNCTDELQSICINDKTTPVTALQPTDTVTSMARSSVTTLKLSSTDTRVAVTGTDTRVTKTTVSTLNHPDLDTRVTITTVKINDDGSTVQGIEDSTPTDTYVIIGVIGSALIVILITVILIVVVCKKKNNRKSNENDAQLATFRTCNERNNEQNNTTGLGNFQNNEEDRANDIYNEFNEHRRQRPRSGNVDDVYDHALVTNIYGKLERGRSQNAEDSNYDSMAAIRAAEGAYGELSRKRTPQVKGHPDVANEDLYDHTKSIDTCAYGDFNRGQQIDMQDSNYDSMVAIRSANDTKT